MSDTSDDEDKKAAVEDPLMSDEIKLEEDMEIDSEGDGDDADVSRIIINLFIVV